MVREVEEQDLTPILPETLSQPPARTALVLTYNVAAKDPRARNQIRWLTELGFEVVSIGRGATPAGISAGNHRRLWRWPLPVRMLAYLILPSTWRYRFLVGAWFMPLLRNIPPVDLVVANTIDFLPWVDDGCPGLAERSGSPRQVLVDLHEYSFDQGSGLAYRLLFKRYQSWLCRFIASPRIDARTTVSRGISTLYAQELGLEPPTLVRNVPEFVDQRPSRAHQPIELIHHGKADSGRGIEVTIDAMRLRRSTARLTLMLVGEEREIARFKLLCRGLEDRIRVIPGVPMSGVAKQLNQFDAEVIHFPPTTVNLTHVLPNKLFESIQGRLALIVGPSPELAALVEDEGIGVVATGWSAADLAEAIDSLTAARIDTFKAASDRAAERYNLDAERTSFETVLASLFANDSDGLLGSSRPERK